LTSAIENISKEFHVNFSVHKEKQDDCVGIGSLCVKEEFFRQETNIKIFLNESKQCTPLGMIVNLKIIIVYNLYFLINYCRRYTIKKVI